MKKLYRIYTFSLVMLLIFSMAVLSAAAVNDMWTPANEIIVDVYNKTAGISTVLAGLMSAVAVIAPRSPTTSTR